MIHPFFDELRSPETRLPNGKELPPLFNFTPLGKLAIPLFVITLVDIMDFYGS